MVSQVANACMAVLRGWGEDFCTYLFFIFLVHILIGIFSCTYSYLYYSFMYFCINLAFHISNEGDDPVHLAVDGHAVAEG